MQTIPRPIVGRSAATRQVLGDIAFASKTDSRVLITGETGTGKELVARHIHHGGRTKSGALVPINCPAITDTVMQSELFGHRKGSFTSAHETRNGYLRSAVGGTALFDEIGDSSPLFQKTVLRFLESGEIQTVGEDRPMEVDVRVLASTNRDLRSLVEAQTFRQDLYYRLSVVPIHIPPLRDRREDIEPLLEHYVEHFNRKFGLSVSIDPAASRMLVEYDWPGNVRELSNLTEHLVARVNGRSLITPDDLMPQLQGGSFSTPVRESQLAATDLNLIQRANQQVAEELYDRMKQGDNFWHVVYEPFMARNISRPIVREVVRMGLEEAKGNYKVVALIFRLDPPDYKRMLNFLRKYDCQLPFAQFRR